MRGTLIFKDGTAFEGMSFGNPSSIAGEVVFTTGMVGYPESLTDPSYEGQILVFTYPLLGNYGVPAPRRWESKKVHAAGVIVSHYINTPCHYTSTTTLGGWLTEQGVPALEVKDTRALAKKLRTEGATLGKIVIGKNIPFEDPNKRNLVGDVSVKRPFSEGRGRKTIVLVDCGAKENIRRSLLARGVRLVTVPWNHPFLEDGPAPNGVVISNGPGDPKVVRAAIENVKKVMRKKIPALGICLGNQLLALAAGGNTYKLKFGHRSQNQPCRLVGTDRSYLTTQNHGFAVGKIPAGFREWFVNGNDGTNEGLVHKTLPFMSVQFHPEATPGPNDTDWIFDHFLKHVR